MVKNKENKTKLLERSRNDRRITKFFQRVGLAACPRTLCNRICIHLDVFGVYTVYVCRDENKEKKEFEG
jgi:hypothetical protein